MSRSLEGKLALVTGASRGIGKAIALAMVAEGAEVVVSDLRREWVEPVVADIVSQGGRARPAVLDVSDEASVTGAIGEILQGCASIPLLVNNAGITRDTLLLRMKKDDWDAVIDINLTGAYRVCRAVVPSMVKARYGRIVNIASVVGAMGNAGQGNYAASKAGLMGFTRSLAREVASRNVTVNCVAPGFIDTDMTRALSEEARARLLTQVPIPRLGTPEDVAQAVVFLLGDGASYITGTTLHVNGGMYM